jgi:DNA repair exonuclease SbcCD ATPase subunit
MQSFVICQCRYLTAREQQLRDRRRKAVEKLDVNDQLKKKEEEIKQLENKTKQLKQLQEDMKWATESKYDMHMCNVGI